MGNLRFLIIGEDTLCRDALCRLLADYSPSLEIQTARNVHPMKEPMEERQFDLIFVVALPLESDHGAAVRSVKSAAGRTPVAALGLVDAALAVRSAIGAGASAFLSVMSPPPVVLHAVELMLNGGVYLPPSVLGRSGGQPTPCGPAEPKRVLITRRQTAVLRELAKGKSNKQIANALKLSEATVKAHLAAIMKALNVNNRTRAMLAATEAGILP